MICTICKKGETSVVDSRPTEDGTAIRRRRLCVCGARFTTLVINSPTFWNSFKPKPLVVAAWVPSLIPEVIIGFSESNGIPFDTEKPMITSGIRLGTQAATTRGFGLNEFQKVGELITKTIKGLSENPEDNSNIEKEVRNEVIELTSSFPIYKNLK